MKFFSFLKINRFLVTVAIIVLVMTGYMLLARPYQLNWGATDQEVKQSMPGRSAVSQSGILRYSGDYYYGFTGGNLALAASDGIW